MLQHILQAVVLSPEEIIPKKIITSDRGGFAEVQPARHATSSVQHSLTGVELAGATLSSDERLLIGADAFSTRAPIQHKNPRTPGV